MRFAKPCRRILTLLALYTILCAAAGIFLGEETLHPARRPLTAEAETTMRETSFSLDSEMEETSIQTPDAITLRGWMIHPRRSNGDAVILLHGLGDNRIGMTGYAQLFLAHGFLVLLPDARAHGASGGELATYGLLERNDIHEWFDFLLGKTRPRCIYGFGESMGAAELLQSLAVEPRFCAVAVESSFSTFKEIAYDRIGQPLHLGPWFGRTIFRPAVKFAFLYFRFKDHLDMENVSPEDSVANTQVPVLLIHGQIDSNIPIRHSRRIHARNFDTVLWEVPNADHCGAVSADPKQFAQHILSWFAPNRALTTSN
jgi:pimeloyl-ACP methyl ester carboxylesterase